MNIESMTIERLFLEYKRALKKYDDIDEETMSEIRFAILGFETVDFKLMKLFITNDPKNLEGHCQVMRGENH
jgi:hypothetical protein